MPPLHLCCHRPVRDGTRAELVELLVEGGAADGRDMTDNLSIPFKRITRIEVVWQET